LKLSDIFTRPLTHEEAVQAISLLEDFVASKVERLSALRTKQVEKILEREVRHLATKEYVISETTSLKEDIHGVRMEVANLRTELKTDIAGLRSELRTEMKDQKVEIIKWMFSLIMGQTVLILGIVYFLIRMIG